MMHDFWTGMAGFVVCGLLAMAMWPGSTHAQERAVTYEDRDSLVVLDNGLIRMEILKSNATIRSVIKDGEEMITQDWGGSSRGAGYIQMYPTGGYRIPNIDEVTIREAPGLVDVRFRQRNLSLPFAFDVHYVMRDGVSGFYGYMVLGYDHEHFQAYVDHHNITGDAAERARMQQLNFCYRMNQAILNFEQVDDVRKRRYRTEREGSTSVMDATFRESDGRMYTKYDFSFYHAEHQVHGLMGNGHGAFVMQGTGEHLNGGPTTQELSTEHGILLQHFNAAHFGSGDLWFDEHDDGWEKLAGPFLFYFNQGEDNEELWWDAWRVARDFADEAPYTWMDHPLYPVERGTVAGTLKITDGTNPEGAMVILAQPEDEHTREWQQQGKAYFFWSWVDAEGRFEIPRVRPNTYSIYVLHDEQFGEFQHDGVSVAANGTTDVGELVWEPDVRGEVVWQIGKPDRTAREYVAGEGLSWGRWRAYMSYFPDDVDFVIGESDEARDWFYVHPLARRANGEVYAPKWRVRWEMDAAVEGEATLRIGIAGSASRNGLELAVNGEPIGEQFFANDSGPSRSGYRGRYREAAVAFDAGLLQAGENVLTLQLVTPSLNYGSAPAMLQYDALRLELDRR